jgi:hypothetical protein
VPGSAAWLETALHTNPKAATVQQVVTLVKHRFTVLQERMLTLSSSRALNDFTPNQASCPG